MLTLRKNLGESYTPLYFLAALGNGGLVVTFFMYLQFMVPHEDYPIATFDAIYPYLTGSTPVISGLIIAAMIGILVFAVRHIWTLVWNIQEYRKFKKTEAYATFHQSNAGVSILAIPLTLAMSINVGFIMGGVFVPGLWNIVEYLFPAALLGFAAVGFYAMKQFTDFFTHRLTNGSFDCSNNNSLSQMIAIFAFAMVGVGFSSAAAMSHQVITATIGAIGAIFFFSQVIVLGVIKLGLGFRAMLEHGINREQSPSLWIVIPILTVVTIGFIRLSHGMHHHFESHSTPADMFLLTTTSVSIQLLFGILGYAVMKRLGYFEHFLNGEGRSAGSYALICPGVALMVLGMFFLNVGLVQSGVIDKFSIAYYILIAPLAFLQIKTIMTVLKIDRRLLKPTSSSVRKPVTSVS